MSAPDMVLTGLLAMTSINELFALPLTNPVVVFAVLMSTMLAVPLLCKFARIPEVVGLIIAGMILGPLALGVVERDGAVELLGTVGLLYIMFQAGLEIDLNGFLKNRSHSMVFGGLTFAMPMLIGGGFIYLFLRGQMPPGLVWPGMILLASTFASHTLLSYPIIGRLGLVQDPAVTTTLGGTIITDTLALLVLAIIAAMVQGETTPTFWVKLFGFMALFTAFVLLAIPRLSRWFFRNLESDGPMQYVFVLATVFGCAVLAMVAGMEDIIGAFFAGLAINRLIPQRSSLANRIDFVGRALFIPMFLISVGMIVDVKSLLNPTVWAVSGVIVGSVIIAKVAAAFITKAIFGYSSAQGWVIFGLSVAQAAATLAATMVGVNIGLFNDVILNGVVMLILATSVISPWITERYGRIVARESEEAPELEGDGPQRLLIPLANPSTTESLMNIAVLLHDPKSEEPLFPLTVAMDGDGVDERVAQGEKNLESAVNLAVAANRPVSPITSVDINVADGIIRTLTEKRIRTVLIGWNGQVSAEQRVFGSILDRLLDGSEQTLFVYRHARPTIEHKRVVLAVPPFSTRQPGFFNAVTEIWTLCQQLGVQLHVITPRDGHQALQSAFNRVKPAVTANWIDIPTWDHMLPELQQKATPEDLIILMAARSGSIAWGPDLDRLPRQLAQRFPTNSFMVVYPQNAPTMTGATTALSQIPAIRRLVNNGGRPLSLDVFDDKAAIDQITQHLPISVQGTRLEELLAKSASSSSIRVTQGTVLIDAHDPSIHISSIIVAHAAEDHISFRNLPEPVKNVWVLVTGSDISEADHMTLLTTMSQRLRQAEPGALQNVHSVDDIIRVLGA